ncbi:MULTISPECIES: hypothetical protein [unclassified Nostoc]|uniref:hypothetical protein n=1 Tax=unclassified Nostoc TaxID=2593658 RepID=UPI00261CA204|nr:hypothetical protein [Nostoc sp. S13]MDF5738813.1 hypothetical protein [Nostoc sp. S13]
MAGTAAQTLRYLRRDVLEVVRQVRVVREQVRHCRATHWLGYTDKTHGGGLKIVDFSCFPRRWTSLRDPSLRGAPQTASLGDRANLFVGNPQGERFFRSSEKSEQITIIKIFDAETQFYSHLYNVCP